MIWKLINSFYVINSSDIDVTSDKFAHLMYKANYSLSNACSWLVSSILEHFYTGAATAENAG